MAIKDSKTRLDYIDKETDTDSNLGDYVVRKYDSFSGRFITPDVLFEKYAGWSPYHYSLDNPVSYKDFNGKDVTALDLQSREDILNSLPNQIRGQIVFSDAGLIDRQTINSINSDDGNFLALRSLVNNDQMTYVENREDIVIQDMNGDGKNDLIPMEKGIKGFTATPTSPDGKYLSIYDNIIHVQINTNSSSKTRAKYIGHELYGHALFYILGKNCEHDYQGDVDQNTELKLFIFDREKNSEENYENK